MGKILLFIAPWREISDEPQVSVDEFAESLNKHPSVSG